MSYTSYSKNIIHLLLPSDACKDVPGENKSRAWWTTSSSSWTAPALLPSSVYMHIQRKFIIYIQIRREFRFCKAVTSPVREFRELRELLELMKGISTGATQTDTASPNVPARTKKRIKVLLAGLPKPTTCPDVTHLSPTFGPCLGWPGHTGRVRGQARSRWPAGARPSSSPFPCAAAPSPGEHAAGGLLELAPLPPLPVRGGALPGLPIKVHALPASGSSKRISPETEGSGMAIGGLAHRSSRVALMGGLARRMRRFTGPDSEEDGDASEEDDYDRWGPWRTDRSIFLPLGAVHYLNEHGPNMCPRIDPNR
jgi:hypothetical protein